MKPTQCLGVLTLRAGQYSTSVRFFFLLFGYRQCEIWHLAPLRRDPIFIFSSLNCAAVKKYLADAQLSHRQGTAGTSNPPEKKKVEIDTRACTELAIFHKVPSPVVNFLLCRTPFSVLQTDRKHLEEENDTIIRKCPLKRIFKASFSH